MFAEQRRGVGGGDPGLDGVEADIGVQPGDGLLAATTLRVPT